MKRKSVEQHLAPAPLPVRRSMLANQQGLAPGAAAVIGRFFEVVQRRREPLGAPSAQSFREAAKSEPTFRTLLRTLREYAPMVSTAGAIVVKAEWVSKRPKTRKGVKRPPARSKRAAAIDIQTWPVSWQSLYAGLERAQIKPSSLYRYRASINRCAQIVALGHATAELNFLTAYHIAEALPLSHHIGAGSQKLRARTVANYIEGLVVLGRHGGADPDALDGVRFMRDHLCDVADAGDKLKFERINEIMEKGGFQFVAEKVGGLRILAAALSDHAAEKTRALQAAALCSISMNKPARTGDVSRWRIDEEIVRQVDGTWWLGWDQEKNAHGTEAGVLWPEVGEVLDEFILGGRPNRFIHLRYRELVGKNWMTLTDQANGRNWPSKVIKDSIGIPMQDLRTLAADYLRLHDPASAANVISAHLGHKTKAAGEEYRTLAEGDAAARSWANMRASIATG